MKICIWICLIFMFIKCHRLESIKIKYKKSVKIRIDSNFNDINYIKYFEGIDKNFILILTNKKELYYFNIETKSIDKIIKLQQEMSGFLLVNQDSIYMISASLQEINLIDSNGDIIEKYNFKSLIEKDFYCEPRIGINWDFIKSNDYFFFCIGAGLEPKEYYKEPVMAKIKINGDEITDFEKIIHYPELYQGDDDYLRYWPSYVLREDKIIVSYQTMHSLYVYYLNGEFIRKYPCKSKYIDEFKVYPKDKNKDIKFMRRFQTSMASYNTIIYDKYRDVYYRIAEHRQKIENDDGTINRYSDKPWSIMILDSDFNLITEQKMQRSKYSSNIILVVPEGLLVLKNSDDLDFLEFALFELVEEN